MRDEVLVPAHAVDIDYVSVGPLDKLYVGHDDVCWGHLKTLAMTLILNRADSILA